MSKRQFLLSIPSFLRKKKEPPVPDPLRLKAKGKKAAKRSKTVELGAAHEILGVKALRGYERSVLVPYDGNSKDTPEDYKGRFQLMRAIAYHDIQQPLEHALRYLTDVTFLVRSIPLVGELKPFLQGLRTAKAGQNRDYQQLIDAIGDWTLGDYDPHFDGKSLNERDILYWGLAGKIIPEGKTPSASLSGAIPTYEQLGSFIHSVIHRLPISFADQKVAPLLYANPSNIEWDNDGYRIDNRAFAFWKGHFQLEHLRGLLALDLDILLNVHTEILQEQRDDKGRPQKKLYILPILRSSCEIENWGRPKLDLIQRQLRFLGKWDRVTGYDVRVAFQQFVPGSAPIPEPDAGLYWHRRRIERHFTFQGLLVSTVGSTKELVKGDFAIGHKSEEDDPRRPPVLVDLASRLVATAVVVQTGGGKTTYSSSILALQHTSNILLIQLHRGAGEAAPLWARWFGGDVLTWDLPDVLELGDSNLAQQKESELMRQDENDARRLVSELGQLWKNSGQPTGLPLIIRPKIPSIRYFNKATVFLKEFAIAWEDCFVPKQEDEDQTVGPATQKEEKSDRVAQALHPGVVIIDDFSKLPGESKGGPLGDIPMNVGMAAHELLQDAVNSYRKAGMRVIFTTQNEKDFERFTLGFLESCTCLIRIRLDPKAATKIATFVDPADGRILFELDITLSRAILNVSARLEDRR